MGRRLSSKMDAPDHYGSGDFDLSESPQNFMMQPTFAGDKQDRESPRQKAVNAAKASLRTPEETKPALKVQNKVKGRDYTGSSKRGPAVYQSSIGQPRRGSTKSRSKDAKR